jgi:hypothetical protein
MTNDGKFESAIKKQRKRLMFWKPIHIQKEETQLNGKIMKLIQSSQFMGRWKKNLQNQ